MHMHSTSQKPAAINKIQPLLPIFRDSIQNPAQNKSKQMNN